MSFRGGARKPGHVAVVYLNEDWTDEKDGATGHMAGTRSALRRDPPPPAAHGAGVASMAAETVAPTLSKSRHCAALALAVAGWRVNPVR